MFRHTKAIQAEFKKKSPNFQIVMELAQLSFNMRRRDILENASDMKSLLIKYPFFQREDMVNVYIMHLFRIVTVTKRFSTNSQL